MAILVFVLLSVLGASSICPEYVFRMIPLKDRLVYNYLHQYINLSPEECGEKCIETLNCGSFSYKPDSSRPECYLHYKRVWAGQTYIHYSGSVIYWLLEDICPSNYTYNNTYNICYKAYLSDTDITTWGGAFARCQADGGYLFLVNSLERLHMLDDLFKSVFVPVGQVFTGGNDKLSEGNWNWLDGSTTFHWTGTQPNGGTSMNCVGLHTEETLTLLNIALSCNSVINFICEIPVRL